MLPALSSTIYQKEDPRMPRVLSEEHKQAMAAGRERQQEERRTESFRRVAVFGDWSKADAAYHAAIARGDSATKPERVADEDWPTEYDFQVVNGEEPSDV